MYIQTLITTKSRHDSALIGLTSSLASFWLSVFFIAVPALRPYLDMPDSHGVPKGFIKMRSYLYGFRKHSKKYQSGFDLFLLFTTLWKGKNIYYILWLGEKTDITWHTTVKLYIILLHIVLIPSILFLSSPFSLFFPTTVWRFCQLPIPHSLGVKQFTGRDTGGWAKVKFITSTTHHGK